MKNFIQDIGILFISLLAFSCSDDFLSESRTSRKYLDESSPIVISPDWAAKEYSIFHANMGDAKFTVDHVPSWLNISSLSGQFVNGTAILNCKADKYSLFSKIGFYCAYIDLLVEDNGLMVVPITYIIEGIPVVEMPSRLTLENSDLNNIKLPIKNIGNGILTWSVSELPEWLSLQYNQGTILISSIIVSALRPSEEGAIYFYYHPTNTSLKDLSGKIVITTNDKNNPKVEVQIDLKIPHH